MACARCALSQGVDFVTPTLGRSDTHEQLHGCFAAQTIAKKRLFVLDESSEPSPFFRKLRDSRVNYVHAPNRKITSAGQGGIAAARNRLLRMTSAPVIAHFDDDDWYAPSWAEEMLSRLAKSDLAKSVVWNMRLESDGSIWQWDTRDFSGKVWAIKGGEPPTQIEVQGDLDPQIKSDMQDAWLVGFGFSYVYRRGLWERFPFPEHEKTEDIPWIRRARRQGARLKFVSDVAHLCLHTVHPRSESVNFPQRRLTRLTGQLPSNEWNPLPSGQPVKAAAGKTIAVLACLKKKHDLKSIFQRCSYWKVSVLEARDDIAPKEFGVRPAPDGYRLVYIVGAIGQSGSIPWGVPAPLSVFDKSTIVKAWEKAANSRAAA